MFESISPVIQVEAFDANKEDASLGSGSIALDEIGCICYYHVGQGRVMHGTSEIISE